MDILVQVKTTMDKFEEAIKAMAKMPKDELMKAIEENNKLCTCPVCPTYNNCAKTGKELLFCASGKSFMCISENKGCICPACPITDAIGLKHTAFCIKGSEKAQRYESAIWGTKVL